MNKEQALVKLVKDAANWLGYCPKNLKVEEVECRVSETGFWSVTLKNLATDSRYRFNWYEDGRYKSQVGN